MLQFWHPCRDGREKAFPHEGGIMSAEVWFARTILRETISPEERTAPQLGGWDPESFAREQIRGLVRQLFFSSSERLLRQIVVSAVDRETDVRDICRRVGEELALETAGNVGIAGDYPQTVSEDEGGRAEE